MIIVGLNLKSPERERYEEVILTRRRKGKTFTGRHYDKKTKRSRCKKTPTRDLVYAALVAGTFDTLRIAVAIGCTRSNVSYHRRKCFETNAELKSRYETAKEKK